MTRGATVISDWTACSTPVTADLSSEPDATYRMAVRATDAAGNVGAPATNDYLLDTAAPAAPAITATPVSPGTDATPTWSFTAEAGAAIECRLTGPAGMVSDWASCTSPATFDVSAEPDGAFDLDVRATDPAGNTGPATTTTYALDRSVPARAGHHGRARVAGLGPQPVLVLHGRDHGTHECRFSQGATIISDWAPCVSPRSYDLSLAPDAAYTFDVRGRSSAGTLGPVTTRTYVLDTVAPVAPVVGSGPVTPGTDATPTWTFTAEMGSSTDCRVTGPNGLVSDWTACASPFTPDISAEPDGAFTVDFRATDAAGNVGAVHSEGYSLDRFVPTAPVITSVARRPRTPTAARPGPSPAIPASPSSAASTAAPRRSPGGRRARRRSRTT